MAATIKYKGVDIGTVEAGKTATIKCSGKKMKDNIIVSASPLKLQEKTVTGNGEVTHDEGYDGLKKVIVNVAGGGASSLGFTIMTADGYVLTDINDEKITARIGG